MSEFIVESEYTVCMKLLHNSLVGAVVGYQGVNKKKIEDKYGCKVEVCYKDGIVRIVGTVEEKVKKSQKMVISYISKCSLAANIHSDLARRIVGPNGDTIKRFRESTGAHIKVSNNVGEDQTLLIYGKQSNFERAKEMVVNILESQVKSHFSMEPSVCFRDKTVKKGFQKAKYIAGQLSPTPQKLCLEFEGGLNSDETKFETNVASSDSLSRKHISPLAIRRNCAVLAPYKGDYYRARVLNYYREGNEMGLLVDFVDFGNYEHVNFWDVLILEKQYCYPPLATICQISNIKPKIWDSETLEEFCELLNDSTKFVSVKVYDEYSKSNDVVKLDLSITGIGDVGGYLVEGEYAEWVDDPFDINNPPVIEGSNVTSVPILVEVTHPASKPVKPPVSKASYGYAPIVEITVFPRSCEKFTSTRHFRTASFQKSIMSAYTFASKLLKKDDNDFLERHTLHFSTEGDILLYDLSGGAALTLGILSVCLKFKIPNTVSLTGMISEEDGKVLPVGSLREKLLAAVDCGKKVFYVPRLNEYDTGVRDDIVVKPIDDIYDILQDMI